MFKWLKNLFKCEHQWVFIGDNYTRQCIKCNLTQKLKYIKYPTEGEKLSEWVNDEIQKWR